MLLDTSYCAHGYIRVGGSEWHSTSGLRIVGLYVYAVFRNLEGRVELDLCLPKEKGICGTCQAREYVIVCTVSPTPDSQTTRVHERFAFCSILTQSDSLVLDQSVTISLSVVRNRQTERVRATKLTFV